MKRLMSTVSVDRCLFIVLDDLKANPRREYIKVLNFLGVKDDGRNDFPLKNAAKEPKSLAIKKLVVFLRVCKEKLGFRGRFGILSLINKHNVQERTRPHGSGGAERGGRDQDKEEVMRRLRAMGYF